MPGVYAGDLRSTKAGVETPATLEGHHHHRRSVTAQRRPGSRPRRHLTRPRSGRTAPGRSTKAGVETPATRGSTDGPSAAWASAQRRPGSRPRRHFPGHAVGIGLAARSTKAGVETPATLCRVGFWSIWPLGRSTKAGVETPATRCVSYSATKSSSAQRRPGSRPRRHGGGRYSVPCTPPLNEGRGRDPGDTLHKGEYHDRDHHRSTKAGVETPATQLRPAGGCRFIPALNEGRGRDPGDTPGFFPNPSGGENAQRRPGSRPRRHVLIRAIPSAHESAQRRPGSRPRRHSLRGESSHYSNHAQRRPGSRPRRHNQWRRSLSVPVVAQRRPGSRPRRHGPVGCIDIRDTFRAQRRPGSRPRRHTLHQLHSIRFTIGAQRRPGSRPRRHIARRVFGVGSTDAQRRPGSRPRRHAIAKARAVITKAERSTKAGVETPATPS